MSVSVLPVLPERCEWGDKCSFSYVYVLIRSNLQIVYFYIKSMVTIYLCNIFERKRSERKYGDG